MSAGNKMKLKYQNSEKEVQLINSYQELIQEFINIFELKIEPIKELKLFYRNNDKIIDLSNENDYKLFIDDKKYINTTIEGEICEKTINKENKTDLYKQNIKDCPNYTNIFQKEKKENNKSNKYTNIEEANKIIENMRIKFENEKKELEKEYKKKLEKKENEKKELKKNLEKNENEKKELKKMLEKRNNEIKNINKILKEKEEEENNKNKNLFGNIINEPQSRYQRNRK